jgi:cyclase|tara:strand:+ start:269 stop:1057 length:789 start_codon:yes stop_codon:yes gene_type:complete
MIFKRIIYALLYSNGNFHLSRNFRLQKVGDVNWLKDNFGFGETCDYIDELMIINVTQEPTKKDFHKYFNDVDLLRKKIFVPITLGGGIRNFSNAKACFDNGADKILINYLAHKNLNIIEEISKIYGEQAISIMVDFKLEGQEFFTYVNSGKIKSLSLGSFLKSLKNLKFGEIILNSIDRDGTAAGLEIKSLENIPSNLNNPVLLMGGAGKPEHFFEVLNNDKISGLITANLFNFLGSGLEEARQFSLSKNINLIKFSKITNE